MRFHHQRSVHGKQDSTENNDENKLNQQIDDVFNQSTKYDKQHRVFDDDGDFSTLA